MWHLVAGCAGVSNDQWHVDDVSKGRHWAVPGQAQQRGGARVVVCDLPHDAAALAASTGEVLGVDEICAVTDVEWRSTVNMHTP